MTSKHAVRGVIGITLTGAALAGGCSRDAAPQPLTADQFISQRVEGRTDPEPIDRPGQVIVDLGCTPGSWAQYTRRKLSGKEGGGITGTIIGLDLLPMEPIADVHYIQGDFREDVVLDQLATVLEGRKTDLVLSDMATPFCSFRYRQSINTGLTIG